MSRANSQSLSNTDAYVLNLIAVLGHRVRYYQKALPDDTV